MRIAYLILAHHQPSHLRSMIKALTYNNDDFFVHLDLKSHISQFENIKCDNVFFTTDRVKVCHAGFSQVKAMIVLMQEAMKKDNYDYFMFLSGVDYPLKTPKQFHKFLEENNSRNFINYFSCREDAPSNYHLSGYFNEDLILGSNAIISLIFRAICKFANLFFSKRSLPNDLIGYRGSAYWCLNNDAIKYILQILDSNAGKKLLMFFEKSFGPDEMVFHTILLNSTFAESCNNHDEIVNIPGTYRIEKGTRLHYIEWDPKRENPALLNERDFEKIKESGRFFARKFCINKSAELLKMIDKYLLEE